MTKYLLEANYTKSNGTWHSMHPEEGPLEIIRPRADEWEKAFKECLDGETFVEYHIYITDLESGKRMEHRNGRARKRTPEEILEEAIGTEWCNERIKKGLYLVLPLGRDADIYHVHHRKSKFGKDIWEARRVSYHYMAMVIARDGDDCLWCNGVEEARKTCKLMAETYGGKPALAADNDPFMDRWPEAGMDESL